MDGATFYFVANTTIALLIAGSFFAIARFPSTRPGVYWFALSYSIGAMTPVSELLVAVFNANDVFVASSFLTFSLAFHVMAKGLLVYFRRPHDSRFLYVSFLFSIVLRAAIWHSPRTSVEFALGYQIPFAVIFGICTWILWRARTRRRLDGLLTASFGFVAVQFLAKPAAAWYLGGGATAAAYANSQYALLSQALSEFLFILIAILLILIIVRDTVEAVQSEAEIDALSGIMNRRAFDRLTTAALRRRTATHPGCAMMFDLDRFKEINDAHGHAAGDLVIKGFAAILKNNAPPDAIVARTGGEEFSAFLSKMSLATAQQFAIDVQRALASRTFSAGRIHFNVTTSCGIAEGRGEGREEGREAETLNELMKRADRALYQAKTQGRNRFCVDERQAMPPDGLHSS